LLVSILVIILAGCGVVLHFTDGYFVRLPPSVPPVYVHRRKLYPWFWRSAVFLLLIFSSSVPPRNSDYWVLPLVFGGMFLMVISIILFSLYAKAGRNDRGEASVRANPWIQWTYLPAQQTPDTYFGHDGLLHGDEYTPWILSGSWLECAVDSASARGPSPPVPDLERL